MGVAEFQGLGFRVLNVYSGALGVYSVVLSFRVSRP